MTMTRQRLTRQDKETFKHSLSKFAEEYGRDVVKAAAAKCAGNAVYVYVDDVRGIVGFEAISSQDGAIVTSLGETTFRDDAPQDVQIASDEDQIATNAQLEQEGTSSWQTSFYNQGQYQSFANPQFQIQSDSVPPEVPLIKVNTTDKRSKRKGQPSAPKHTSNDTHKVGLAVKIVAIILVVGIVVGGGLFAWHMIDRLHSNPNPNATIDDADPDYDAFVQAPENTVVHISVVSGDNIISVRQKLLDAGCVSIARDFAPAMRAQGGTNNLKAAEYVVAASESASSVAERMSNGTRVPAGVIGVNEGDDIYDIARSIDSAKLPFSGADFLTETQKVAIYRQNYSMLSAVPENLPTLEGYFPEGEYNLGIAPNVAEATHVMLRQAQVNFDASGLDSLTYFIVLTKASMIEKEAMFDDDRPLIASVIENRLARNMALQIDATVKYATGSNEARVLYADTEVDSPYNTYRIVGLPIGPICSGISKASYHAALNPTPTDYLYYVLKDRDGHHAFSSTSEQFEIDRQNYLRLFGYTEE